MDIEKIKKDTGAKIIIIADQNGKVIKSSKADYIDNFALMTEAAFSMCDDLLQDITASKLQQLIAKSEKNFYIVNRLASDHIILIASDDMSRFGLLINYIKTIEK